MNSMFVKFPLLVLAAMLPILSMIGTSGHNTTRINSKNYYPDRNNPCKIGKSINLLIYPPSAGIIKSSSAILYGNSILTIKNCSESRSNLSLILDPIGINTNPPDFKIFKGKKMIFTGRVKKIEILLDRHEYVALFFLNDVYYKNSQGVLHDRMISVDQYNLKPIVSLTEKND